MAFELATWERLTGVSAGVELRLPHDAVAQLSLGRRPRAGHFAADVGQLAGLVGADLTRLANLLRSVEVISTFVGASAVMASHGGASMLAAARDRDVEGKYFGRLPDVDVADTGWLSKAVERLWDPADSSDRFPRDFELRLLTELPIALVEMSGLRVASLSGWMMAQGLPALDQLSDRSLRGCLLAYAGVGIIFVDADDSPDERRATLAHEGAHFLLDYVLRREEIARRQPELLDVLDGVRPSSPREQFEALIADLPLGMHVRLFDRGEEGGFACHDVEDSEQRADRVALELLAPARAVLDRAGNDAQAPAVQKLLLEEFGLPAGLARRYAHTLVRFRPRKTRSFLEIIDLDDSGARGNHHSAGDKPHGEGTSD
ncbi:hypothetical protein ACRYCC_43020 [Actinomadura scrupuli]|uniref:ImmA/IrrE family metallo-endopeptidase n=1 Tax=Actinomadura scrupuli TaxID=559629 RepID=UPI003D99677D